MTITPSPKKQWATPNVLSVVAASDARNNPTAPTLTDAFLPAIFGS